MPNGRLTQMIACMIQAWSLGLNTDRVITLSGCDMSCSTATFRDAEGGELWTPWCKCVYDGETNFAEQRTANFPSPEVGHHHLLVMKVLPSRLDYNVDMLRTTEEDQGGKKVSTSGAQPPVRCPQRPGTWPVPAYCSPLVLCVSMGSQC
jgi:hypothetical protein